MVGLRQGILGVQSDVPILCMRGFRVIQVCACKIHVAFCSKLTHPFPASKKHYTHCTWAGGMRSERFPTNKVRREVFVCASVCCVTSFRKIMFCSVLCCIICRNSFPPIREFVASCQQVASNFYECLHGNSVQISIVCDTVPQTINYLTDLLTNGLTDGLTDGQTN